MACCRTATSPYLQTPLQPMLLAPLARTGAWLWPVLRAVNALLGFAMLALTWRAAREAGVAARAATVAVALFACCDIVLFSVGVARNDALPAACLAAALVAIVRADRGAGSRGGALAIGFLLAAAAAAKISYAPPALAYGVYALVDRRHRPSTVLAGALPILVLVGWTYWQAPDAFMFEVLRFPSLAPADYYAGADGWKLSAGAKLLDALKFLALGPALLALVLAARDRWAARRVSVLEWLAIAGLLAALLPTPSWRQYLLVALPPVFVRLAMILGSERPAVGWRAALAGFAVIGLVPSVIGLFAEPSLPTLVRDGRTLGTAMDAARITGPVATLSPELLPATGRLPDIRFATGPFVFRSRTLLTPREVAAFHLVTVSTIASTLLVRPEAVLVGEEGRGSGSAGVDAVLERWAVASGYRRVPVANVPLRLYVAPR